MADLAEALTALTQAERYRQQYGGAPEAQLLAWRGWLWLAMSQPAGAQSTLNTARNELRQKPDSAIELFIPVGLARLAGDRDALLASLDQARQLSTQNSFAGVD